MFHTDAAVSTFDTLDDSVLGIIRENEGQKLTALFNFSEFNKVVQLDEEEGSYTDLISGKKKEGHEINISGYGVYWLLKQ